MKKITLVLGGIRSGKSYFAEQRAEYYAEDPVYIATAIPGDGEMKLRVAQHQKRRGSRYQLIEAPYDLTGPLGRLKNRTVLGYTYTYITHVGEYPLSGQILVAYFSCLVEKLYA